METAKEFTPISVEQLSTLKLSHFFPFKGEFLQTVDMWGNISIYKKCTNLSRMHMADVLPLK